MSSTLIAVFLVILAATGIMLLRVRNYRTAIVAMVVAVAIPILWVGFDCLSNRTSEACVWGKSFMPLFLGIAVVIGAPLLYLLAVAVGFVAQRIKRKHA